MKEKKNKHEMSEKKHFEKKEKMMKSEPEYKKGGCCKKMNYKGNNC